MNNKKLAFVGNSAQTMINFRYGVMKSLAQSGYNVYVIAPKDCDVLVFRKASINFIPIEIDCKGVNPFRDLALVRQLRNLYKKEKFDVDKEIERISRKTRVNIMKSERLFESRINQLEKDIDSAINSKKKLFDENNMLKENHILTDYTDSSVERYKKKLNKI